MTIDYVELFENLSTLDPEELIRLADDGTFLADIEHSELIFLVQELAGRLEDYLNLTVNDDERPEHVHEYNG